MHKTLMLRYGAIMGLQDGDVLLNGLPNVAPGFLDRQTIAEAPRQTGAVREIPRVFRLLFDHNLKVVEFHDLHSLCLKQSISGIASLKRSAVTSQLPDISI
jgi:hypothetical protein